MTFILYFYYDYSLMTYIMTCYHYSIMTSILLDPWSLYISFLESGNNLHCMHEELTI